LCRTALIHAASSSTTLPALLATLRDSNVVDDIPGTLQLAAAIDRRLRDHGALAARGVMLHEALLQPPRGLYEALAAIEPLPGTLSSSSRWQAIGPLAQVATPVTPVEPAAPGSPPVPPPPSTAQKIEDELTALKARMLAERGQS
jgi:hypothetical protein